MAEAAKKLELTPPPNDTKKSLATKLSEIIAEVSHVEKKGVNDFHKYKYAQEADVLAAVRKHLAERHILILPSLVSQDWHGITTSKGQQEQIARVVMEYTLIDGDSGERLTFKMPGEGQDRGDKGSYKAVTGATKYALTKLFLIPTGDDPEADADADKRNAEKATITDEQAGDLATLIENVGAEEGKVLAFFKVTKLTDLTPVDYAQAVRMLEKRKKA
jgi:hypothetical protein